MNNLLLFVSFLTGLSVGSFLNCLIYRLHKGESFWKGRSYCPKCKHKLGILDLIPVFSFIFLRGKCRYCHQKISWQYPLVELCTAILFTLAYLKTPVDYSQINSQIFANQFVYLFHSQIFANSFVWFPQIFAYQFVYLWFFISVLLFIFIYDLKYYLIPDKIILPAIIITLIFNIISPYSLVLRNWFSLNYLNYLFYPISYSNFSYPNILNLLLAAAIGGGFFLVQFLISKGRWVGGGDIRLGILMGLILGWPAIFLSLFLAYIIGAIIGIGLIVTGKKGWQSQVPFGPFLAGATIVVLLL